MGPAPNWVALCGIHYKPWAAQHKGERAREREQEKEREKEKKETNKERESKRELA